MPRATVVTSNVFLRPLAALKHGARALVGDRVVRRLKVWRLHIAEGLPLVAPPSPGLRGLDERVRDHVGACAFTTFIEFGANDGVQQSNTYLLERDHGWTGVLVEPVAQLAAECMRNRPGATVVCGAVVAPADAGRPIGFLDADLMSHVATSSRRAVGLTLSSLIDELFTDRVGLVVVDVEGAELEALAGLDLQRHRPVHLLVETADVEGVERVLAPHYDVLERLSHHDWLFRSNDL